VFAQEGEKLLQVREQLALNGMRAFKGGAPLPAALVLAPPQATQVDVVDAGFFVRWVHFGYPISHYIK